MLSDPLPNESKMKKGGQPVNLRHKAHSIAEQLVKDAHKTFVSCFHAFYPTGPLKWVSLCSLLNQQASFCNRLCDYKKVSFWDVVSLH